MPDPLVPQGEEDPLMPDNVVDWAIQQRRAAGVRTADGLEGNADDAARAVQLGQATGEDSQLIYNNLEDFERNHKAALASELVHNSPFLRGIADSHPLATTLAQDDWGQLAKVGDAIDQMKSKQQMDYTRGRLAPIIAAMDPPTEPVKRTPEEVLAGLAPPVDLPLPPAMKYLANFMAPGVLDVLPQVVQQLGTTWQSLRTAATVAADPSKPAWERIAGPITTGVGEAINVASLPVSSVIGAITDDIARASGGRIDPGELQAGIMTAGMFAQGARVEVAQARRIMQQVQEVGQAAKPFIDAGITPPLGVHPTIDQMWIKQAEEDLKNLQNLQKEAGKSALRERAPDLFEQAINKELDQSIGISAEAIRKLYGDKPIQIGDGLLGDAGNVAEQLILAEMHGGEVQIPMGKWLAKVDTETQKALENDVTLRTQGLSVNAGKELQERIDRAKEAEEQTRGETEPETITSAAVQVGGKTYTDAIHQGAFTKAWKELSEAEQGNDTFDTWLDKVWKPGKNDGFITSKGRYVDREEAYNIAKAADQLEPDLNKLQPWLDASLDMKAPLKSVEPRTAQPVPSPIPSPLDLARSSTGTSLDSRPSPFAHERLKDARGIIPDNTTPSTFKILRELDEYKAKGSFRATDGLARINPGEIKNGFTLALLDFFEDTLHRLAGDVTVHAVSDNTMQAIEKEHFPHLLATNLHVDAFYDPVQHHIIIRSAVANGSRYGHDYAVATLTEEVAHAATVRELRNNKDLRAKVTSLREWTKDWLGNNKPDRLQYHSYELSNNEEFIAWAWKAESRFKETLSEIPISPALRKTFGLPSGLANAWDAIREFIKKLLTDIGGKVPPESVLDGLLRMGPEFEKANAEMRAKKGEGPQLPGRLAPTMGSDPILERIKAYGMNAKRAENYRKLVEKAQAEDAAWQLKQGEKVERRQQTAEWQANQKQMREDVEVNMKQRPQHAADRLLRLGEFHGQKVQKVSLDKAGLTPEQIKSLPENYFNLKNKVSAEQLAQATGFSTSEQLIDSLTRLHAARTEAGLDPAKYLKSQVDAETQRQMQLIHGDLEQNIMHDAQEHVLGASTLDVVHEELIALAERAKVDVLDKAGIKAAAEKEFNNQKIEDISREKYQSAAMKHAQAVEDELAKGDRSTSQIGYEPAVRIDGKVFRGGSHVDALDRASKELGESVDQLLTRLGGAQQIFDKMDGFINREGDFISRDEAYKQAEKDRRGSTDARDALQHKSQQVVALHLAGFAKKLEKEVKADEKLRKSLSKTEPSGIDPEYAIHAQDILSRTGTFVKRTLQGMERQRDLVAGGKSLREFVDEVNRASNIWQNENSGGFNLPIPDFLLQTDAQGKATYRTPVNEMTVDEFRSVALALKALNQLGREEKFYTDKGGKRILSDILDGLTQRISDYALGKSVDIKAKHPGQAIGTFLLNPETWFNRLDLFNPRGPMNQLIIRPIVEGSYESLKLRKEMARDWKEVATFTDTGKKLPDSPFKWYGEAIPMTKQEAYVILANMGNELQRKKLAGGYGIKDVQEIWDYLGKVLTKEDMDRQAKIGQMFEKWFGKSEEMYAKLRGWIPDRIELGQVMTPWGVYDEWYHPLIKDPDRFGEGGKTHDILDDSGYFKPSPGNIYTKQRTGAIYPIDLSFGGIARRAEQIANDIAMRPPITEVSKIVLSGKFKDAMTRYMGPEYRKAMEQWLRDSAGQLRDSAIPVTVEKGLNYLRQNASTLMIGLNIGTVMKHTPTAMAFSIKEVGPINFLNSFLHMAHETDTGQMRWKFAWENSNELPTRLHQARESIASVNDEVFKRINWDNKFFRFRDIVQSIGAAPVAIGDLMSAVPMWDAKYRQLREEGLDHGDAVYEADQAVRRTHGSTIVANRPGILRAGSLWNMITPFYNFFSNDLQRLYEYGVMSKLAMKGRTLSEMTGFEKEEYKKGLSHVPTILGGLITFALVPSAIEQGVDPLPRGKGESNASYWTRVMFRSPISTLPGIRDIVNFAQEGHDPGVGLYSTIARDASLPLTEIKDLYLYGRIKDPAKAFKNSVDAIGLFTGLTYHSAMGNLGEYMINLDKGKEPSLKGITSPLSILRHGTLKGKETNIFGREQAR